MADTYDELERTVAVKVSIKCSSLTRGMSLEPIAVMVQNTTGPPLVIDTNAYTRVWEYRQVELTAANFIILMDTAKDNIVFNDTYPNLKVHDQGTSTPTSYPVMVILRGWHPIDLDTWEGDIICVERTTSSPGDLTIKYDGSNSVVLHFVEMVLPLHQGNIISRSEEQAGSQYATMDYQHKGPRNITVTGYIDASGDFDKILQYADSATARAVTGAYLADVTTRALGSYFCDAVAVLAKFKDDLFKLQLTLREDTPR